MSLRGKLSSEELAACASRLDQTLDEYFGRRTPSTPPASATPSASDAPSPPAAIAEPELGEVMDVDEEMSVDVGPPLPVDGATTTEFPAEPPRKKTRRGTRRRRNPLPTTAPPAPLLRQPSPPVILPVPTTAAASQRAAVAVPTSLAAGGGVRGPVATFTPTAARCHHHPRCTTVRWEIPTCHPLFHQLLGARQTPSDPSNSH
jgi:hypothetical protein